LRETDEELVFCNDELLGCRSAAITLGGLVYIVNKIIVITAANKTAVAKIHHLLIGLTYVHGPISVTRLRKVLLNYNASL
jgi:hypothetical protein